MYHFIIRGITVYNNEIHVLGNDNKHYKWNGNTWNQVSNLPYNADGAVLTTFKNTLCLLGGAGEYRFNYYKYNNSNWVEQNKIKYSCYNANCIEYNNNLYGLQGYTMFIVE